MKFQVTDAEVDAYAQRILQGGPLGKLLPGPLTDCDFTPAQRELIRIVRAEKRKLVKKAKAQTAPFASASVPAPVAPAPPPPPAPPPLAPQAQKPKTNSRLQRLIYLQSGKCFFCGEVLNEGDANIEHLNPKSRGGSNALDNVVACHKSLNQTFGDMDLKQKFAFVLKHAGSFKCPQG